MRILIIAMPRSIHTARWISQIADQGWDIHLFPSIYDGMVHSELRNLKVHIPWYGRRNCHWSVQISGVSIFNDFIAQGLYSVLKNTKYYSSFQISRLLNVVKKVKPDIIHSLEIQHAGYLTLEVKKRLGNSFPPWIVTNWGSDLFLFGRLQEHKGRIREVMENADYYSCECRRDVCLAEVYGFKGKMLPVFPNTGGFDLFDIDCLRSQGPTSSRRVIMLKGYQHWAGRGLVGLRALERCADVLVGYTVVIFSVSPDVEIAARLFQDSTGVSVVLVPNSTSHREILALHGTARISIGLSISDAISTSFLEALVMGSFPIQSWTACADEWIENGRTGLLVPPEDPDVVEQGIRNALADDEMVDKAADENWRTAKERLDYGHLKQKVIDLYAAVAGKMTI